MPTDSATAAAVLADTADDRARVIISGGRTKLNWGGRVNAPELEISTSRMSELLDYRPDDLTVAVQAGMPLAALQPILAEHGQQLAINPPSGKDGATIGGLLATGDAGSERHRYGNLRDLAIGCTVVLADGTIARVGGQVIKNVAGYDITKLMHGSLGSLGLLTEIILRLHPIPAASRTIIAGTPAARVAQVCSAIIRSGADPTALQWYCSPAETGTLLVRFDGSPRSAEAAATHAVTEVRTAGVTDVDVLSGSNADDHWARVAIGPAGHGRSTVRIGTLPAELPRLADVLERLADRHQVGVELSSSTGIGLHTVRLAGTPQHQATCIDDLGAAVQQLRGNMQLHDRPAEIDAMRSRVAPLPDAPATTGLQRAVKDRFDPDHRLAPGRFAPWF